MAGTPTRWADMPKATAAVMAEVSEAIKRIEAETGMTITEGPASFKRGTAVGWESSAHFGHGYLMGWADGGYLVLSNGRVFRAYMLVFNDGSTYIDHRKAELSIL
jgi:hypothetical protein